MYVQNVVLNNNCLSTQKDTEISISLPNIVCFITKCDTSFNNIVTVME